MWRIAISSTARKFRRSQHFGTAALQEIQETMRGLGLSGSRWVSLGLVGRYGRISKDEANQDCSTTPAELLRNWNYPWRVFPWVASSSSLSTENDPERSWMILKDESSLHALNALHCAQPPVRRLRTLSLNRSRRLLRPQQIGLPG